MGEKMVLKELKKVAKLGLKASGMKKSDLEKHLAPMVKAGKITATEAKSLAEDLISVGKTHHERIHKVIKKQVEKELKAHGYVKVKAKPKVAKKKTVAKKATKKRAPCKKKPCKNK